MNQMDPAARSTDSSRRPVVVRHDFLTKDHTVQRAVFADGWRVIVNFGTRVFKMGNGLYLMPMSFRRERSREV